MTDPRSLDQEDYSLVLGIGHCIMQWAFVELQIAMTFHALHGDRHTADLLWARIRSFEAKLQFLVDLVGHRQIHSDLRRDFTLLRDEALRCYRLRNAVAHSTLVKRPDGTPALEPFLQIYSDNPKSISGADMNGYVERFMELSEAWLHFHMALRAAGPHPRSLEPTSGLARRLRMKDDQTREAQRHRNLAWRQYLERNPDLPLE